MFAELAEIDEKSEWKWYKVQTGSVSPGLLVLHLLMLLWVTWALRNCQGNCYNSDPVKSLVVCFNFHFKGLRVSPLLLLSDEMRKFLRVVILNPQMIWGIACVTPALSDACYHQTGHLCFLFFWALFGCQIRWFTSSRVGSWFCSLTHMGCELSSVLSQESAHMNMRAECWLLLELPFGLSSPRICHLHPSLPLSSEHPGADSLWWRYFYTRWPAHDCSLWCG